MPEPLFQVEACNFIKKETLAQLFSCEFYEIFKSTFFTEHLPGGRFCQLKTLGYITQIWQDEQS